MPVTLLTAYVYKVDISKIFILFPKNVPILRHIETPTRLQVCRILTISFCFLHCHLFQLSWTGRKIVVSYNAHYAIFSFFSMSCVSLFHVVIHFICYRIFLFSCHCFLRFCFAIRLLALFTKTCVLLCVITLARLIIYSVS